MDKTLAILLAGGRGSRLNILATHRAKPAVPFAGMYRIIDVTLSNLMNSNIDNLGILTQYRPSSLIKHIQTGESWGFYGRNRSISILSPYTAEHDPSWYTGTADAVYQNLSYINSFKDIDKILIVSGDHIYNMDYRKLIEFHKEKKADITVVGARVPLKDAHRFGTITANKNNKITRFEEKVKNPKNNLISLGIYIFNKETLIEELKLDSFNRNSTKDFGKDILPNMVAMKYRKVYVYPFTGYWKDVGTLDEYWKTNMDFLNKNKIFRDWAITTNFKRPIFADRNPTYIAQNAVFENSLISDGCIIDGRIENSIISPGVKIEKGAYIKDSIIFNNVKIKKDARINKAIIDKNVIIGENSVIGEGKAKGKPNKEYPQHLSKGITIIGKNSAIPSKIKIGKNCIISSYMKNENFNKKVYQDGETIR